MKGVNLIDLNFQDTPGVIASYILDTGDGLAVVDTGPASTLPALSAGLEALGAGLDDVRWLLLTHIHLDHAGAAGTILARVPGARAYVHERGAKHLASPERLVASATQIYGDAMDRLWGEMLPIPAEKLTVLAGGETLQIGDVSVDALYTPGHAVHHLAYHTGPDLFVGDVGGVRLDTHQTARAPTPPPDIDLEVWKDSVATLRERDAQTVHVAHFGSYAQQESHWDGLLEKMDLDAGRVRAGMEAGQDFGAISAAYTRVLMQELLAEGEDLPARYDFACPPWMSVQGLTRYWHKKAVRPS